MSALSRNITVVAILVAVALTVGFIIASGRLYPLPAPGTRIIGLTVFTYEAQGILLVALGLLILWVFLIPRLARVLDASFLLKLLVIAYAAKMIGALARLWTGMEVIGFSDVARSNRLSCRQRTGQGDGTVLGSVCAQSWSKMPRPWMIFTVH